MLNSFFYAIFDAFEFGVLLSQLDLLPNHDNIERVAEKRSGRYNCLGQEELSEVVVGSKRSCGVVEPKVQRPIKANPKDRDGKASVETLEAVLGGDLSEGLLDAAEVPFVFGPAVKLHL